MVPLLDGLFEHFSVPLRGLALTAQSPAVGEVAFLLLLARPLAPRFGPGFGPAILRRATRLTAWAGLAVAVVAAARVVLQFAALTGSAGMPLGRALGAGFVGAWGAQAAAGLAIAVLLARRDVRPPPGAVLPACLAAAALAILGGSVATSHATGRLEGGPLLAATTALHELGAAVWIGGLPCFLAALALAGGDGAALRAIGRRYSLMSMAGVAAVVGTGAVLAVAYVGSWAALYGTAHGMMTGVKTALFLALLGLGAANYRLVERLRRDPATPALRLRRFAEVELGIGVAVFLAAASLTSAPPGVDVAEDRRVMLAEIVERVWPPAPQLRSPDRDARAAAPVQVRDRQRTAAPPGAEMSPPTVAPDSGPPPRNVSDAAWSEFEHDWAGILLLAIGALAVAERSGLRWGRRWPLLLLGFALFLVLESDPAIRRLRGVGSPEGSHGDGAAGNLATVLVALVLVVLGLLEWAVRTGRVGEPRAALAFPLACAGGALLLLAPGHVGSDPRAALLVAVGHGLVALLGLAAGWSRWVELRMPGTRVGRGAAWTWPMCLLAIGLVLLGYREAPWPDGAPPDAAVPSEAAGAPPWPG